jgi:ABC-type multidrug transport system fused ATPase/permease subunit
MIELWKSLCKREIFGHSAVIHKSVAHTAVLVTLMCWCHLPFLFCLQATGQRVGIVLQSIATIGLGVGFALYYEWRLGLVVMCFTPLMLLAQYSFLRIARGEALNNQKALEKSTKVSKVSGSVKLT